MAATLGAYAAICRETGRPFVFPGSPQQYEAVVDITGHPKAKEPHGLMVLVNPRVVHRSEGSKVSREGCLSLPDLTANVRRPRKATVEFQDGLKGLEMNQVQLAGFEARCVLHEIDHLDGILFLDRVASITDDLFRRQTYK